MKYIETRVRGKDIKVPSVQIAGRTVMAMGKWLRIAAVQDEELVEGELITNPETFITALRKSDLAADIVAFPQHFEETKPKYSYYFDWDNVAVISTKNFNEWWERLPQEARKNARRAAKRGVSVRIAPFDDEFIGGIKGIYDESPVRQGMQFWHFGKDLDRIKLENGTYIDRSEFIGAYVGQELAGFIKLVYVNNTARILQILAKTQHYDKRPMNALIAKAVEVCSQRGISYLIYSKFTFGNKKNSPLREFKRRIGFEEVRFPRYFVPLTLKGRLALKLRVHREWIEVLPSGLITMVLNVRAEAANLKSKFLAGRGSALEPSETSARSIARHESSGA